MPYKDKSLRNAKARARRANDPAHAEKTREYMRLYSKRWREGRLEKQRAYDRAWHKAKTRKDRGEQFGKRRRMKTDEQKLTTERTRRRRFYAHHKDEINTARSADRIANPEKYHALDTRRWREHKEERTLSNFIQRAKRYGGRLYCTPKEWVALLKQFDFKCFYCHVELTKKTRTIDHKLPISRGGTNEIENLVPACRRCNLSKNSKTAEEFLAVINP
jgi:5-methylcytosine-specific restriction endonuclease McrA